MDFYRIGSKANYLRSRVNFLRKKTIETFIANRACVKALLTPILPIGQKGWCEMKRFDGSTICLVLLGFVIALLPSGGGANADFSFDTPMNLVSTVNSPSRLAADGITQTLLPCVGIMGDSLTDEYQTDEYLSGLCWVEQLVKSRRFDFGAFSSVSRGEPRRSGYEYNWARYGARATGEASYDLPSQWAGLANQVVAGEVAYVCLIIGNNDFGAVGKYDAIARGSLAGYELEAFIDSVVGRIETALHKVSSAGNVRIVLGNITDNGLTAPTQQRYSEGQRARVTDAVMRANDKISAIANQRVIPVIDLFGTGLLLLQDSLTIGGVLINTKGTSNDPHYYFLSDGLHPGTVVQGLLANAFIEAINRAYDTDIEPLSDQEILANAGIVDPNPGTDPTCFDVSGFVLDPAGPRTPDLNGDGIVDSADICIMVDYWHTDEPSCDIAPPPYGDGIVDVQDLIIAMDHWGQIVTDPTLIAHWPLDETGGDIAYDRVSVYDGILHGNPVWQPDGGIVAGALQFDGLGDYVSTEPILNPAHRTFSVAAWIKGGAPGQIILSQTNRTGWLRVDLAEGYLMTGLKLDRSTTPLSSQTCITDGTWHRIGFVWDGTYRHLYVDGKEVATDASPISGLASAEGGLYFGAGSTLAPGSFFSGLIDDIRIYSRALRP